MAAMNIWRIPILFIISGMGLGFAIKRRNWKMLLKDRSIRILVPYIFGFLAIGPLNVVLSFIFYNDMAPVYIPNPGHLWFLGNIYFYVLITLAGLVYLYNKPNNVLFRFLEAAFKKKSITGGVPIVYCQTWNTKSQKSKITIDRLSDLMYVCFGK